MTQLDANTARRLVEQIRAKLDEITKRMSEEDAQRLRERVGEFMLKLPEMSTDEQAAAWQSIVEEFTNAPLMNRPRKITENPKK